MYGIEKYAYCLVCTVLCNFVPQELDIAMVYEGLRRKMNIVIKRTDIPIPDDEDIFVIVSSGKVGMRITVVYGFNCRPGKYEQDEAMIINGSVIECAGEGFIGSWPKDFYESNCINRTRGVFINTIMGTASSHALFSKRHVFWRGVPLTVEQLLSGHPDNWFRDPTLIFDVPMTKLVPRVQEVAYRYLNDYGTRTRLTDAEMKKYIDETTDHYFVPKPDYEIQGGIGRYDPSKAQDSELARQYQIIGLDDGSSNGGNTRGGARSKTNYQPRHNNNSFVTRSRSKNPEQEVKRDNMKLGDFFTPSTTAKISTTATSYSRPDDFPPLSNVQPERKQRSERPNAWGTTTTTPSYHYTDRTIREQSLHVNLQQQDELDNMRKRMDCMVEENRQSINELLSYLKQQQEEDRKLKRDRQQKKDKEKHDKDIAKRMENASATKRADDLAEQIKKLTEKIDKCIVKETPTPLPQVQHQTAPQYWGGASYQQVSSLPTQYDYSYNGSYANLQQPVYAGGYISGVPLGQPLVTQQATQQMSQQVTSVVTNGCTFYQNTDNPLMYSAS